VLFGVRQLPADGDGLVHREGKGQISVYLFVKVHVHAESQHALDPVPVRPGVGQLEARAQRGRLEQHHRQVGGLLVLRVALGDKRTEEEIKPKKGPLCERTTMNNLRDEL